MNRAELHKLLDHLLWADESVWKTVLPNPKASKDEYIKNTLFHSSMTIDAFCHVWNDEEFNIPKNESYSQIEQIKKYSDSVHGKLENFSKDLDKLELDKIIVVSWSKYFEKSSGEKADQTTLLDTIVQVIMHTTYHRGQISKRLRELEINPPLVDYITWLWSGKPLT